MDVAGARALARRIEEQQARRAAQEDERRAPAVTYTPISGEPPPPAQARVVTTSRSDVEIVHVPARSQADGRDVRMYTRHVRRGIVDGREAVVTTIRCQALVDGRWESRVVEVIVDDPGSSG
jgi:hypothetical protein